MSTPFMGEIKIVSFGFAPKSWAQCNGQFMPINQNQALFSLLGTTFGGNGQTTFALPDLRGRVAMGPGNGHDRGEQGGQEAHTIIMSEMAAHNHAAMGSKLDALTTGTAGVIPTATKTFAQARVSLPNNQTTAAQIYGTGPVNRAMAASVITNTGGSQAHENRQPYQTLNFCIALQGIFPSQN
ncbi:MAG: phage tail protein [Alphaproteobacteria bacterium]|nr:MAG: phage tail protein [Alphaproteobacteria bacterium]